MGQSDRKAGNNSTDLAKLKKEIVAKKEGEKKK